MKKALLSCALMLVLSLAMLAGTSYAWFSDEQVVEDNSIILGNLEMDVTYTDPTGADEWYSFAGHELFDIRLVEPGAIYRRAIKVKNTGNINLAVTGKIYGVEGEFAHALSLKLSVNTYNENGMEFKLSSDLTQYTNHYILLTPGQEVVIYIDLLVDGPAVINQYELGRVLFDLKLDAKSELQVKNQKLGNLYPLGVN